jgi:hypothetical protein
MVLRDSLITAGTPAEKGEPMSALYGFQDRGGRRHAVVRMDNGDAVHISVTAAGVSVRWSRFGIVGRRLYRTDMFEEAAATARRLEAIGDGHLTPPGMDDPLLRTFTKAVVHCSTVAEVSELLNGELEPVEHGAVVRSATSEGVA